MTNHTQQLTFPDGSRYNFERLIAAPLKTVEDIFQRGTMPKLNELAGWEFQGRNLSFVSIFLRIRRFTKGFTPLPEGAHDPTVIDGYNILIKQKGGHDKPWIPWTRNGVPLKHGFFKVHTAPPGSIDDKYPQAIFFDYAEGVNPWWHPGRRLKDYTVQVYPDDPTLLVGKAYFALGSLRIFGGHYLMRRNPERT